MAISGQTYIWAGHERCESLISDEDPVYIIVIFPVWVIGELDIRTLVHEVGPIWIILLEETDKACIWKILNSMTHQNSDEKFEDQDVSMRRVSYGRIESNHEWVNINQDEAASGIQVPIRSDHGGWQRSSRAFLWCMVVEIGFLDFVNQKSRVSRTASQGWIHHWKSLPDFYKPPWSDLDTPVSCVSGQAELESKRFTNRDSQRQYKIIDVWNY